MCVLAARVLVLASTLQEPSSSSSSNKSIPHHHQTTSAGGQNTSLYPSHTHIHTNHTLPPSLPLSRTQSRKEAGGGEFLSSLSLGRSQLDSSSALADGLDQLLPLDVIGVVGLHLGSETREGTLQGLLGGGVDHLGL